MKGKFVQIAALCLAAGLLLAAAGGTASAVPVDPGGRVIRVGLHYGTGAMEGLNLQNNVGSGFQFGYYNSLNQFVPLGSTGEKSISAVETLNVYYGIYNNYSSYHTAVTSNVAVGEYHLQLPGSYSDFAQAQSAALQYGGFAAYIGGVYYARMGSYTTGDQARTAQASMAAMGVACDVVGTSEYGISVVKTTTSNILFQYDDRGQGTGLGVEPIPAGNEKCTTWSKGFQYPGGFRFERIGGGKLTVVNMVEFEDYIEGVIATEMSDDWPVEALKAQAVAARSYAVSLGSKHSAHHFDICDSTDCQAYTGQNSTGANTRAAVEQTAGLGCLYNGKAAETYYYSSNGGASESISNVWGGGQAYPYLVGKADPYEPTLNLKNTWERTFTSEQIISRLLSGNNVTAPIVSAEVTGYTEAGNPRLITFTDSAGKRFPVSSATVYSYGKGFGLPSFRFGFAGTAASPSVSSGSVSVNGSAVVNGTSGLYAIDGNGNITAVGSDAYVITSGGTSRLGQGGGENAGNEWGSSAVAVNGSITFAGRGSGHNIGMSQWGAYAMAQQGYDYQKILQFYYTGITVGYV